MRPLFETILAHVPAPAGEIDAPLQFQVSALDYSSYVGRLGIGRIRRGSLAQGQEVAVLDGPLAEGAMPARARVGQIFMFEGLNRVPVERAAAGDIVLVTGIDDLSIGCTLTDTEKPNLSFASAFDSLRYASCIQLPDPSFLNTYTAPESAAELSALALSSVLVMPVWLLSSCSAPTAIVSPLTEAELP